MIYEAREVGLRRAGFYQPQAGLEELGVMTSRTAHCHQTKYVVEVSLELLVHQGSYSAVMIISIRVTDQVERSDYHAYLVNGGTDRQGHVRHSRATPRGPK
jgi:hypothetical protein